MPCLCEYQIFKDFHDSKLLAKVALMGDTILNISPKESNEWSKTFDRKLKKILFNSSTSLVTILMWMSTRWKISHSLHFQLIWFANTKPTSIKERHLLFLNNNVWETVSHVEILCFSTSPSTTLQRSFIATSWIEFNGDIVTTSVNAVL